MAYIECPQCGQSALAVATRCPRCGFSFTQHRLRHGERRPVSDPRFPMWIGGGVVVLAIVFLAARGDGGAGTVTVPPVASGLAQAPETLVVEGDSAGSQVVAGELASAESTALAATVDSAGVPFDATVPTEAGPAPAVSAAPPRAAPDTSSRVLIIAPEPIRATPPKTVEPEAYRWASTWVNVRAGRSGTAAAVRVLNPGEQVGVDSLGRGWFRVLIDGRPVGYVDRSFLALAPPDSLPS